MWAGTDVDGIMFMDDWGSQENLIISPAMWRDLFKPLYKEYCDLIHRKNKNALWKPEGGIIAQCEFGLIDPCKNIESVFESWEAID